MNKISRYFDTIRAVAEKNKALWLRRLFMREPETPGLHLAADAIPWHYPTAWRLGTLDLVDLEAAMRNTAMTRWPGPLLLRQYRLKTLPVETWTALQDLAFLKRVIRFRPKNNKPFFPPG